MVMRRRDADLTGKDEMRRSGESGLRVGRWSEWVEAWVSPSFCQGRVVCEETRFSTVSLGPHRRPSSP